MKGRLQLLASLLWMLPMLCVMASCGDDDDDYHYPSVTLEFLTAQTDGSGNVKSVLTDEGKTLNVAEDVSGVTFDKNSTLRIVSNYATVTSASGAPEATLYASLQTISPVPQPADKFEAGVERDPVDVTSIWMGLDYLNMILDIKAQNGKHLFHFVEQEVSGEGSQRFVHLLLYHKDEDTQAYSKRAYMSVPLRQYATEGVEKVTVQFSVITYSGGEKSYRFEYTP